MKLSGIFGKGSGKIGSSVWAVSSGEQIVREYNPNVSNPQSDAQVAQRAKLKLMSQLAASMADYIAISKKGLVSARNIFIKKNIGFATFSDGEAKVEVEKLQLTDSNLGLSPIVATAGQDNTVIVQFADSVRDSIYKVCYCAFMQDENDKLVPYKSEIISTPGTDRLFPWVLENDGANLVFYAYGIIPANGEFTTVFGDYTFSTVDQLAHLIATRALTSADVSLTKTVGVFREG